MKRSHDEVTRPHSIGSDGPAKDEPLKTETNGFVRSIMRSIDDDASSKCAACGRGGDSLEKCSCNIVKYCNRACQKAHLSKHRKDCVSDDIDMEHIQQQHENIAKHVASSWKWLDSYPEYDPDSIFEYPPSKPLSKEAKIEAISVFYQVTKADRTCGTICGYHYEIKSLHSFVFHFNDGGELDSRVASQRVKEVKKKWGKRPAEFGPSKLTCGKHRVLIRIGSNEEITVVTALWDSFGYRRTCKQLCGLRIETSTGKVLEVLAKKHGYCNKEETRIPEGHTLRSIQIQPHPRNEEPMFSVETVLVNQDEHTPSFPSLVSLAHDAEVGRLKNAANDVEVKAKYNIEMLNWSRDSSVDDIVKCTRTSIQASPEAAEVRILQAQLAAAQCRLREHSMKACNIMAKKIKDEKSKNEQCRASAKKKWNTDRNSVLRDHDSFLERIFNMSTENAVDKSHSLCRRPECRRVYKKQNLSKHNFCSVNDCKTNKVTCGCSVELCTRCSTFMCSHHMAIHEDLCKEEEEKLMKERHGEYRSSFNPDPKEPRLSITGKTGWR